MDIIPYEIFKSKFPNGCLSQSDKNGIEAREKLNKIPVNITDGLDRRQMLVKQAAIFAWPELPDDNYLDTSTRSFVTSFGKTGSRGNVDYAWELYYWFHYKLAPDYRLDQIDRLLLKGKTFEQKAMRPVRIRTQASSFKAKNAWKMEHAVLRTFIEPILPSDHVDGLIDIIHEVVNENLLQRPIDYKSSIIDRATDEGIIVSEFTTQWLEAALQTGLRPDIDVSSHDDSAEEIDELYRENWRFLTSSPSDQDRTWVQKVANSSEDQEFLRREYDSTSSTTAEGRKRKLLLRCLLATQESSPVIRGTESVIGHLKQISEMNLSRETKDFIDYSMARNAAVTGQSDVAIKTFIRLKDSPFKTERAVEVRYHLINASYALRMTNLYGTKEVSSLLKLSADNDEAIQKSLNSELLGSFDASDEIARFCAEFDISPTEFDDQSVQEYVQRFNGPSGAKIIYFHHLEAILRTGKQHRLEIRDRYSEIVRLLQTLSTLSRSDGYALRFTKDVWYPLVFLHSVAANMGQFDLMKQIEADLHNFHGWRYGQALAEDVKRERESGSFLMLLFALNCGLGIALQKGTADLSAQLRALHGNFKQLRFMPALSQNVMFGLRSLGDNYDLHDDVSALAQRGVSHWNYMIGGGQLDLAKLAKN